MIYNIMFTMNKIGLISEKTWKKYCNKELEKIMKDNQDILKRIKEN